MACPALPQKRTSTSRLYHCKRSMNLLFHLICVAFGVLQVFLSSHHVPPMYTLLSLLLHGYVVTCKLSQSEVCKLLL